MRVFFSALVATSALLLAACSGGTEDGTLQRQPGSASSRTPAPGTGSGTKGTGGAPGTSSPGPGSSPVTPDAGAAPAPAPPAPAPAPAPGSCGDPKCFGVAGVGGCKATDGAGATVTMGCQGGACACVSGGQNTPAFDGDVNSAEDARQLFLINCTCN